LGIEGGVVDAVAYVAAAVPRDRLSALVSEARGMVMSWWGNEKNRAHYRKEYEELVAQLAPLEKPCQELARKAVANGRAHQPRGKLLIRTLCEAAVACLRKQTKTDLAEAARLLLVAGANEDLDPTYTELNRYNLACTYALLGKTAQATETLERCFASAEERSLDGLAGRYISALRDKDLAVVRESDAGKKVMEAARAKVAEMIAPYLKRMAELKSQGYDLDD
jgi:hypothetical protein